MTEHDRDTYLKSWNKMSSAYCLLSPQSSLFILFATAIFVIRVFRHLPSGKQILLTFFLPFFFFKFLLRWLKHNRDLFHLSLLLYVSVKATEFQTDWTPCFRFNHRRMCTIYMINNWQTTLSSSVKRTMGARHKSGHRASVLTSSDLCWHLVTCTDMDFCDLLVSAPW